MNKKCIILKSLKESKLIKSIRKNLNKYDNIIMFLILFIISGAFQLYTQIDVDDELWVFSNVYKMANGYIIYKDINVLQTPLYFICMKYIFLIFGSNYLIFKIFGEVLLTTAVFYIIYKIFKEVSIKSTNAKLYILTIILFMCNCLQCGTYNTLAIFFVLLGIYCMIKEHKDNWKYDFIQGIIIFLVFLSKQNIAVYYIIGKIIIKLLTIKNWKKTLVTIVRQLGTAFLCLLVFLTYLYINNNLYNFLNYTILGISEFAEKNNHMNDLKNAVIELIAFICLDIIILLVALNQKIKMPVTEKNNIKILVPMAITISFIIYPLPNEFHYTYAILFSIMLYIYVSDIFVAQILEDNEKYNKIVKYIVIIATIIMLGISTYNNANYIIQLKNDNHFFSKQSPYYGSMISEENKEDLEKICNFIIEQNKEGYEVKIISYYSNFYMNIFKRNNGQMDLPFLGNLGKARRDRLNRTN